MRAAVLSTATLIALAASAHARPGIALDYVAPTGCPDDISFRAGVIARLGRDPFDGTSARLANVKIEVADAGYAATITLREPDGTTGARAVPPTRRCEDVVAAAELALAVIIDPTFGRPQVPNTTPQPPYLPPPYLPPPYLPWPAAPLPPLRPAQRELALALGSVAGAHPESAFAWGLRFGYAVEHWRAGVFARFAQTQGELDSARTYGMSTAELLVEGCWRGSLFAACGILGVGTKSVKIERDHATTIGDYADTFALLGLAPSLTLPLGRGFVRITAQVELPLPQVQVAPTDGSPTPFELPALQTAFDLALGFRW